MWLFYLPGQVVFSQLYSGKDNYTGAWETPASWNPTWTVPQTTNLNGYNITINGYITVNGSLSFSGTGSNLIINDTLVIKGNLLLENNTQITINDNGILIVRGNLTISNQSIIMANGYLIVTGDIIKNSSLLQGPFTSNDNPVKIFIGGTISPVELTDNYPNFPVLNCTTPITTPYPNSTCSYGNMTDMISDPINSFFQYTCTVSNVNSNISVCAANTINLTSSGGTSYSWSGPDGFINSAQNPSIPNADIAMAGAYMITVIAAPGCTDTDTINVTVNALPIATAGSNSPVCVGNTINLTSSGGISYSWGGPKGFINSAQNPSILNANTAMAGAYTVTATAATGCTATNTTSVIVNALPTASITITDNSEIKNNDGIICNGATATLTASGGTSYKWSSGETTAAITKGTAGTYIVTVTNANGCTDTATATVVVNALPVVEASNNGPVFSFKALNLTGGPEGMTTYSWTGPNGFTSNSQSPSVSMSALEVMAGVYTLTVTNASGCSNTATTAVEINELPIPSVITPNNDGKNDYFVIGEISGKVELIIFNRWGNIEYTNSNYLNDWDGRNNKGMELPNDTYFYILKFESGKIIKGSVLIKR